MKSFLKKVIGKKIRYSFKGLQKAFFSQQQLKNVFSFDRGRFAHFASPHRDFKREANRLAYTVMLYHSLEKGMALKSPKTGFGREKAEILLTQLEMIGERGQGDSRYKAGVEVMERWLQWNRERGVVFEALDDRFGLLAKGQDFDDFGWRTGGVREIAREELLGMVRSGCQEFMSSRHSIRQFSDETVDIEKLEAAVRLAQTSPSLCNRQSGHVHVLSQGEKMTRALHLQGGNRGFAEQVDKLLIVTSELGCFLSVGERNQCWIEGGLFAMALIYGLHAQGLASCCLNWAKEEECDRALHNVAGIPEDQRVIMLIAVGNLPVQLAITHSPRRILSEIMHFHHNGS